MEGAEKPASIKARGALRFSIVVVVTTDVHSVAPIAANPLVKSRHQKNRIQVSNTKKPLFFYLNLAKKYIKMYDDVELSALGMAIPTVVTIAEKLKSNGLAVEKRVLTSTVGSKEDAKGRITQKAKIEIVLAKTDNFDTVVASVPAPSTPKAAAEGDEE